MNLNVPKGQIRRELRKRWAAHAVEMALMGRWDEAIQVNLQVLKLFPDDIQARNRLANAYSELERYDEALEAYEHSLQAEPSNSIARRKVPDLYARLDRKPKGEPGAERSESEAADEE